MDETWTRIIFNPTRNVDGDGDGEMNDESQLATQRLHNANNNWPAEPSRDGKSYKMSKDWNSTGNDFIATMM